MHRLPAVLTVALPLVGTPLAVTAAVLLGDAAHRAVPSVTVPAAVAGALVHHLGLDVGRTYGR
ncbi:hypothetical protein ATKI12_1506 [Kitasatospora sp. Ki12]|uniref:hypothetical protein n=1 Tax=Kitasatospora xanthocidica TaxID=83382 RepID=UPI0016723662|nr:hypothetical protein [Kitasatospora xanthocidica]GHF31365.1 hypothetical protein GCM10018790_06400 [Kitasatospora xanthocidica]